MQDSDGNDLPLKAELEKLPATLEYIEAALDEANHKINSIANPGVLRQYGDRLREIAQIEEDIAASSEVQHAKKTELSSQFKPWEAALKHTVTKVNELFTSYMMELGMAGEVRLASGAVAGMIEILFEVRRKVNRQWPGIARPRGKGQAGCGVAAQESVY
jgi:chromosome segregation ATPase